MTNLEEKVANAILDECLNGRDGSFTVEIECGDVFVTAEVYCHVDGYTEDDYYDGTGAYVVTDVNVGIDNVEIHAYDDDGEEKLQDIELDTMAIERYVFDEFINI